MTYLVVDFEAMCHARSLPIPTEIGCCLIDEHGLVHNDPFFSELICPSEGELTDYDTELTGITPAMLENARSAEAVFTDLSQHCLRLGGFRVVAHNAKFDRGIAKRYPEHLAPLLAHPWIDTIHVAKRKLKLTSYSLDPVAGALGIEISGRRHRAYPDAHLTARAFALMQSMPDRSLVQATIF